MDTPRHNEATMNDKDLPADVPEEVALGLAFGLGAPLDLARALGVFFATALSGVSAPSLSVLKPSVLSASSGVWPT